MKDLCLVYCDEKLHSMPGLPEDGECLDYLETLKKSGRLIAAEPLQSVQTATTVRVRNGKVSVTDRPFAETKEQLAGFYLIDAKDLNEAIQVGSNIPPARVASIEVRPIRELKPVLAVVTGGRAERAGFEEAARENRKNSEGSEA